MRWEALRGGTKRGAGMREGVAGSRREPATSPSESRHLNEGEIEVLVVVV
jgi:hypothetical protein